MFLLMMFGTKRLHFWLFERLYASPTEYEKVLMAGYTWFELVMLNAPEEKLLRTKARLKEQVDKLQSKIEMVDYYLEERLKDQQLENDELVSVV